MKKIFWFLLCGLVTVSAWGIPRVTLYDQADKARRFESLLGTRTVVLVYRARNAADDGKAHLRIVREFLGDETVVIRIADMSKVPGLFKGLAINQIKNKFEDYPYYLDEEGNTVSAFNVGEGEYGLFLYRGRNEEKRKIESFRSKDDMRNALKDFLE